MKMQKIYVGNLPFETDDSGLQQLFTNNGYAVESARVIRDMDSGRSRGFGFVEMASTEEAQKAITQLNGSSVEGRALQVNEARPQAPRGQAGRNRSGGGSHRRY
jgi:RNA recognition motif-containing protein